MLRFLLLVAIAGATNINSAIYECLGQANLSATLDHDLNSTVLYAYLDSSQATADQAKALACIAQHSNTSAAIVPHELEEYLEDLDDDPWDTTVNSTDSQDLKRAACKRPYYAGTTFVIGDLLIATLGKIINGQYDTWQSKTGFECGRCYTWQNKISKNVRIDNNSGQEIQLMWWPHHECRSRSPNGTQKRLGKIVKVAPYTNQIFNLQEGSFYIQCDDEWPDENTGKKVNWPVVRIY